MNKYNLLKSLGRLGAATMIFGATLASPAQVTQILHETITNSLRDDYTGTIGCVFETGSSNVVVSHLGIYNASGTGLTVSHHAGIFTSDGSVLLGSVAAASGTSYYYTNGCQWIALDPPILLSSNTAYLIASDVTASDGDSWNDATAYSSWNSYFVGATPGSTRNPRYSAGGATWPTPPTGGWSADNTSYGNVSVAYIEVGQARVGVSTTNVAVGVGQPLNIVGFASGGPTISYQWFKGVALLGGQTSSTLSIASAALSDSGVYYLTATNSLGGEQSAMVSVSVTAVPVGITQQPTNVTAIANYSEAGFSVAVTGTPPIYMQWSRNGAAIPGANSATYTFLPTSANNGDVFNCLVSNTVSGTPETVLSSNAVLTVIANLAIPQQFLHGAATNLSMNGYVGCVGGSFITGSNGCVVTHLGYYAANYTGGSSANLVDNHTIYIFNNDYTVNASVVVTNGSNLQVINGYIWAPLNPPVTLSPNTTYVLGADTTANDPWGDSYVVPDWSSYYTIPANGSLNQAKYNSTGSCPYYGGYPGQMYSAPNMAILSSGMPAVISLSPTNVTQYVGLNIGINSVLNGAPPVTAKWFKAPSTLVAGQTNSTLALADVQLSDSGSYFLVASNSLGTIQSSNVTVSIVPDAGPAIIQDIASQTVFPHTTVNFSVAASGTPPLSYQWNFSNNPIIGATNPTLTVLDASASSVGNYQVAITNPYGATNSSVASLALINVPWGSYQSGVMGTNLVAYYTFSDVNSGFSIATNEGSLGSPCNGAYEGGYSGVAGPTNGDFEPGNPAVSLDGFTGDVLVPPLDNIVVSNITIAAWVYDGGGQPANTAIFFHRQNDVFGLTTSPDPNTGVDELGYTWNGTYNSFSSGLDLAVNQWVFAALVISPTNATLYLQDGTGMESTNNAGTYTASAFAGDSYIGWDTAGGATGRRWTGPIDDVMVFNQALSPIAINALYLGVPASAAITISHSGSNRVLTWPGGTLQEAANLSGPWTTDAGAISPYTITSPATQKVYRVKLQ